MRLSWVIAAIYAVVAIGWATVAGANYATDGQVWWGVAYSVLALAWLVFSAVWVNIGMIEQETERRWADLRAKYNFQGVK